MRVARIHNYPGYQELVSLACLLYVALSSIRWWNDLPATLAAHFDGSWRPDGYGSKGFNLALVLFVVLMAWGIDALIRYNFLLSERRGKRFNWLQFITVPGVLVGAWCWYLIVDFNLDPEGFSAPWRVLCGMLVVSLLYLLATEWARPAALMDAAPLEPEEEQPIDFPDKFCLVHTEAPLWWRVTLLLSGAGLLAGGLVMLFGRPETAWSAWLMLLGAVPCLLLAGGIRFVVHPGGVEVTAGGLGLPLKTIPLGSITGVELKEYNALAEFGGWGIRLGANSTTGFIVAGDRGALIKTANRNYLLGTRKAALFVKAIESLL